MINFRRIESTLIRIESYIKDCDYATASDMLRGYNDDGTLFDFVFRAEDVDIIATIHNHDNKPVIEDGSFIEIYDNSDLPVAEMSRTEIREQIERLGEQDG